MNKQAFEILEFPLLRVLLLQYAQTEMGRARIGALEPLKELSDLRPTLASVGEMMELRERGAHLSFEGIVNTAEPRSRLRIAGTALEPLAILDLARLGEAAMNARSAIAAERDVCPTLFETVAALPNELSELAGMLRKKILPNGELDDRASPELARIRREINHARSGITKALENLMRRSSEAVQEELVTIRNDRFVIPVRADHQARIKGVTHGSSSSGATVFVEPLETIEANNELQGLREAEQREIAEILFGLSESIRRNLPAIENAADAVTELDFINAKAAFAEKFNCVVPIITEPRPMGSGSSAQPERQEPLASARGSVTLELIDARHPLLEESLRGAGHVVPVSLKLDAEQTTMIISGANAGGKTVILKTAGLLSLMALSGVPVPASGARVPFYRSVLADIGDHQSLAANLSTFTSHVANIASMVDLCDAGSGDVSSASALSLVLLDEVGTGTDPEEGSALGVAVVDHFKRCGAHVIATTHYSGLKMYAANERGVLNASVEFDEKTLQPTYRLLVGLAGSSSGLDIARRFGIPQEIIREAKEQVKSSTLDAIDYLRRIKREAEESEDLRRALQEERAAVADRFATLDSEFQKRERQRQAEFEKLLTRNVSEFEARSRQLIDNIEDRAQRAKVEREAQKRAAELKRNAQAAARAAMKSVVSVPSGEAKLPSKLRGVRVVRDGKVVSDSFAQASSNVADTQLVSSEREARAPGDQPREIRIGDRVRLVSFGSTGIVDQIKGNEAEVRAGSLHLREKLENLELIDEKQQYGTARGSERVSRSLEDLRHQASATELHLRSKESDSKFQIQDELNLIGKTTDEAIDLTDKFLDEAFLNGQSEVRIIHGHGTGALRKAVAELLADHPHVARFAAAPQNQGGSGATVVELRS
jgi:DNA mismatch repair protein MutS2